MSNSVNHQINNVIEGLPSNDQMSIEHDPGMFAALEFLLDTLEIEADHFPLFIPRHILQVDFISCRPIINCLLKVIRAVAFGLL